MIPYSRHVVNFRDAISVARQIRFGSLTQGKTIDEFETKVASYVGSSYAVAVSSATAGLHIALLSLNLEPGDKVITSPMSFLASSNAILYAGLTPVFIDINPETKNIDISKLREAILADGKIKAVIPVHYAGLPCNMEEIKSVCADSNIKIIEDAAHALGGSYNNGSLVGSNNYSDLTVFSFHPVKSVTTGEGGVVTTNSLDLYNKLCQFRSHGLEKTPIDFVNPVLAFTKNEINPWYREMKVLGYHYRLTEIQARLGISQMQKLTKFMHLRLKAAKYYDKLIKPGMHFAPAQTQDKSKSGNHLYPIEINFEKVNLSRAELMKQLRKVGIGTQVHYMPINMNPYYEKSGFDPFKTPHAMNYYFSALSIPIYPGIKKRQQRRIISTLNKLLSESKVS